MHSRTRGALVAIALGGFFMGSACLAQEWPNWRGPNHDGISTETNLKTDWEAKPPVLWQQEIGSAFSSFACVNDHVYTCGTEDKQQVLFCLDADNGELVWKQPFEKQYKDGSGGDGTRATPTVDDGRVYILGARGRLVCVDAKDGRELWDRKFDGQPQWGYAGSVLIEDDLAIVSAGGADGALLALDKKTGKTIWKCGDDKAGYSTPYPFTLGDRRYVVGFVAKSAIIADVETGREVWSMPWETSWDVNAATPIFHEGRLFLSSGYNHGATVLKLTSDGDKLSAMPIWESKIIRAKFQTPVLYKGYLYTSDELRLVCVEFATGVARWNDRGIKHGTVVVADGHLFVLTESGELLIAKATPEGFEPLTKQPILTGRCWTIPTLYKGRLYARNFEQAVCLDLTP